MEPITSDPEFMMRFYQNALYLINWVFIFAGLVGACAYGLLLYSECYSGPPRKTKVSPRTAPEPALTVLKTAHGPSFQLPLTSQSRLEASRSARKTASAS